MSTDTHDCCICSLRQITKTSNNWCPECEEAICDECKEHHKVLKATRNHELIPISNYKSLPSFITNLQQACIYHNEKYQLYCTEHNLPMCIKCIKNHQKCTVSAFEEIINDAKSSEQFQDLETRLEDLLQNIDKIKKDRKANVVSIEEMKKRHVAEIQHIRVEINKHLDNLEKQIIKDVEEKESQCKESIQKALSSVKEKETMINQSQINLQSIKQYASDFQTFLGMRELELKVNENEQYLQSLIETNGFENLDLVCNVDTDVESILHNVKSFGSIEIKKHISDIGLTRAKDKQAQIQVKTEMKTINDVKLIMQKKITTNGEAVRGCCISRNGDFLFTDHASKKSLYVFKSNRTLKYKMSVDPSDGFDITFVDDKNVAITTGQSSKKTGIDIIDTENQTKVKFINLPGRSFGITCDIDSLFVCVEGSGIFKVNTVDYTTSSVISCNLSWFSYVSVFNYKIYYTDSNDHSVVCCDRNGSRIWNFKGDSVLKFIRGLTVDSEGHVFVVGASSSNCLIISKDGKHHKEILTNADGLCEPSAVFFDKRKSEFLVANTKQTAFLYSLTQT
ncbi:uncharacterized protein LOC134695278 [Mytilus trossulus]|uniref:uncharacterized protein LOC134695278 n=1 Tax=Mytilus trossulus TaxID=6551 RepID=UPI003005217A